MLFLPILIMIVALAQDQLALETYCFSSKEARIRVEKDLSSVIVPSDKVESEKNCLTIQMRPHRRELLQKYTKNLDPEMFIQFSSAHLKREPCRLRVEKIRAGKKNFTTANASVLPFLESKSVVENSQDTMEVVTQKEFRLQVNQDAIEGSCRFISEKLYEITLSARRDPVSLAAANLPAGTVIINQTTPPDQKTLSLSTLLQLKPGDRLEIGSIVRDLRKKSQTAEITPQVKMESSEETEEEKVFLSFQTYESRP